MTDNQMYRRKSVALSLGLGPLHDKLGQGSKLDNDNYAQRAFERGWRVQPFGLESINHDADAPLCAKRTEE